MSNESQQSGDQKSWKACPGKCTHEQIARRETLLQAKSSLIDNMIYHIRTLSNAVIGFSDLLLTEPLNDDQSEYVQEISHAGHGLSVLANEVLDWTHLLSSKLKIEKAKTSISEMLREIQKMLSWAAHEKGIGYEIVTDPDMPAYINTDQDQLLKCLVNLTVSAIKYTQQGGVQLHVKTEQQQDGLFFRFDVIDTGKGIDAETLSKIFEPNVCRIELDAEILSQLDKGLTITTGLPLTKQLCELLDGSIEAHSKVGEGSTFTIRIPVGLDAEQTPKLGHLVWNDECADAESQQQNIAARKILLVEDQQSNRTVITLMLESLGVQVATAEGGPEALEKVDQDLYDLILMDLKMPEMDGFEATRRLREKGIEAPIIALSATVLHEKERSQISSIFDGFLSKPVDSEKLSETLQQYFGGGVVAGDGKMSVSDENRTYHDAVAAEHGNENA